jgi:tetratricopeptide (TPR) repeat protein
MGAPAKFLLVGVMLIPAIILALTRGGTDPSDSMLESGFRKGVEALERGHFAEAYCYWRPVAENGHAEAQYHLGWLYANGNGMPVDIETAISWWEKAANQGHAEAEFALGLAYTTGEDVGRDMDKAVSWYLKAAEAGHEDARDIVRRMLEADNPAIRGRLKDPGSLDWLKVRHIVEADRANVRAGPGTDHRIVGSLDKGAQVWVLWRRGGWAHILFGGEGETAWIYDKLLD